MTRKQMRVVTRMQVDSRSSVQRHEFLGIKVDAITSGQLIAAAVSGVESGERNLVFGNHNLHSLHLFQSTPNLREFYSLCHVTHIDGMSLILLGRMLGLSIGRQHRTTYLDWIEEFLAVAESKRWKVYVLGGTAESAAALPGLLRNRYPSLEICSHHGFITASDDPLVLRDIRAFGPDVLMVGMGMPRQEEWIVRAMPSLQTSLIFNCGAAFEYLVGAKYRPPRWAGQLGVEWLFRMCSEPRRLAGRYLVEPFFVLPLLFQAGIRRLTQNIASTFRMPRLARRDTEAAAAREAP
jgi:N-acetylglucosaminyldiphosphoundecaprenol N-acetyl-beta-D-mannosaminyltransferase